MKLYIILENRIIRFILVKSSKKNSKIVSSTTLDLATTQLSPEEYGNPEKITAIVHSYLKDLKYNKKNVALIFNSRQVISRELQIPKIDDKADFKKIVRNEMKSNLLLSDDYIVEYALLSDVATQGDDKNIVLGYAIQSSLVNSYIALFKKVNIKISNVYTGFESFLNLEKANAKSGMSLYFDVHSTYLRMYLFDGSNYIMMRNLRFYEVEDMELYGLQEIIEENISKMEQYIYTKDRSLRLEHIYFFGNHPLLQPLVEKNKEVNNKVDYFDTAFLDVENALENINVYGILNNDYTNDYIKQLSKINKTKKERSGNNKFWIQKALLFLSIMVLCYGVAFGGNLTITLMGRNTKEQADGYQNDKEYIKANQINEMYAAVQEYLSTITTLKQRKENIAKITPTMFTLFYDYGNGIIVEDVEFDGIGIRVNATAENPSQMIPYLKNIDDSEEFKVIEYTTFTNTEETYPFTYYVNINGGESDETK